MHLPKHAEKWAYNLISLLLISFSNNTFECPVNECEDLMFIVVATHFRTVCSEVKGHIVFTVMSGANLHKCYVWFSVYMTTVDCEENI